MNRRPSYNDSRNESRAEPPANAVAPWVIIRSPTLHPFVYKRMILRASPDARPGDVVQVYARLGSFCGRAIYNPNSMIALRMLTFDQSPVDDAFWPAKLQQALSLRRSLRLDDVTDAYRIIHAEGDGLSGLIAERYADHLVFEIFSLGMYQRRELIADALKTLLGEPKVMDRGGVAGDQWHVIIRADERIEQLEGFKVERDERETDASITIREHGVRYRVDVAGGHKTGFFCDQRDNRKRFASFCRDMEVLDLCCYTGGFGLCAKVLGDAREVTSVDLDEAALAVAKKNVNLNQTRVNLVHADGFHYVRQMMANKKQFDVVVCDPPKFARDREEIDDALRKYHDLNGIVSQIVKPGGILLTCSCSGLVSRDRFAEAVHHGARKNGRRLQLFDQTGAGADHPVMMNCPESEYLKALWFRVL
ncbi:MAG: class I SAM-dependent rRNA methyltransferase [Planctomycetes bacterium]|nr:class I SAM-dependent rRNA methyltransferase [Planctomycetota bacterium]